MKHSNTYNRELNKFCYIPFHGFCIDPQGWLTMCCMDPRGEYGMKNKKNEYFPRLYKKPHIDDIEDLEKWWVETYEDVWQKYFENEQHNITPLIFIILLKLFITKKQILIASEKFLAPSGLIINS